MGLSCHYNAITKCKTSIRDGLPWCINLRLTYAIFLLGYPIYAWKGETEEDFWWCIEKCINAPGWNPNMVNCEG